MSAKIKNYGLALLSLFLFWHICSLGLDRAFLPRPASAIAEFFRLTWQGDLARHFLTSAGRMVISLLISFILAAPAGLVLGRSPRLDSFCAPLFYLLYPLPKVVFLPLIVLLLGLGNAPKILLISLIVFFQILVTARDAAKHIPQQWLLSMKSLHASPPQIYYHLVWPYCLPSIFTSLRVSLGTAIAVLFFAETFASGDGLGFFILDTMERRDFNAMYAGVLGMGILGIVSYALLDWLEDKCCRWDRSAVSGRLPVQSGTPRAR